MQPVFVLGVGAQKAGTTWLHNYLQERPDTDMGMVKEYHVLDVRVTPGITDHGAKRARQLREFGWFHRFLPASRQAPVWRLHRMERDLEQYFDYFQGLLRKPGIRITGDITPSYSALPVEALEQVKEGFAARGITVKVVFLMRDPAERALSASRRHREKYPELCPSGDLEDVMKALCRTEEYEARARYEQTLARLKQVFAPEDTFLCLYENLFTPASIERLCTCLGMPVVPARFDERINSAGDRMALAPELRRELHAFYRSTIEGVVPHLGRAEVGAAWPGALEASEAA
jgi:hypothetical protein